MKIFIPLLLCLLTCFTGCQTPTAQGLPPCCRELKAGKAYTDRSLYNLDSLWFSDQGKQIHLGVLRGRPQVVAMFFTRCEFSCPVIVANLKQIEAALPPEVRAKTDFLLISFDAERETVDTLHAYRLRQKLPNEHWTLLKGKPEDVRELAALLGVNYREDERGQFAHSNTITLLNSEGEIINQQQGLNQPTTIMVDKITGLNLTNRF